MLTESALPGFSHFHAVKRWLDFTDAFAEKYGQIRATDTDFMKIRTALLCLVLMATAIKTYAALYAYDGFAILDNNGGGNTYYDMDLDVQGNPNLQGTTFTIGFGQTLRLGGQVKTDPGGDPVSNAVYGAEWARIFYRIDGGDFSSLNLPCITSPTGGWYEQFEQASTANMVNLASGLSYGTHSLDIYIQAHDDTFGADGYISRGGFNYNATIQVVPEPLTSALVTFGIIFGAIKMVRWLGRRQADKLA